jgi:predicted AAA+ superfamily ATPase
MIGKMGKQAYESMPPKAKTLAKDVQNIIEVVSDDLKEDIPKIQKNIESVAKRFIVYADDIERAMKGDKK